MSETLTSTDATPYLPARRSLSALRAAAATCRACALYERATQTVFAEGPCPARLMLVGEIPGDQEDRAGRPFVGPAGRELDRALETAGLARDDAYLTNAVKHFKFEERGKRRIHQKPSRWEVRACVLVLLGATAGQALLGPGFRVGASRGRPIDSDLAELVIATIHPSAILRGRDDQARSAMRESLAADLRAVAEFLGD
jgi:DNA polymerase